MAVRPSRGSRRSVAIRSSQARRVAQPFLKWAGGKRQLLGELRKFYPRSFGTYFEPFLGSGAVFFDLAASGRLEGHASVLTDTNADVIGCYRVLCRSPREVVAALGRLARAHARTGVSNYYDVRDRFFNPTRRRLHDRGGPQVVAAEYTPALAAMLIYLNRTGFNGLFRMNARGEFNVPAGRYANPTVCDAGNLELVSRALGAGVELGARSFEAVLDRARSGDFLYFDPPYAPLTRTARFTAYTAGGFADSEQVRLQQVVVELAARGCHVLVSNSTAPLVRRLYDQNVEARAAGLRAHLVTARRAINCRTAGRGALAEYVISNVVPPRQGAAADRG